MSTEENLSLARQYIEQFLNRGNMAIADNILSPDYRRYLSPSSTPLNVDQQKQRIAGLRAAFPDLHVTIEDVLVEGDRVAVRVVLHGTQRGAFLGIPPTGKPVTVFALDVIRIENGRFVEHWGGPDLYSMVSQLGAVVSVSPEK